MTGSDMATEIEIKAWVANPEAVRRQLNQICTYLRDYRKEDAYFTAPAATAPGLPPQDFRIRRDDGKAICTYKDRSITRGMEVNREVEFDVSDPEAFEELARRVGCTLFARKRKEGSVYRCGGLHAELSLVHGLGYFIEIEKVTEDEGSVVEEQAEGEIRGLLLQLGVREENIEERPYTVMLTQKFNSPDQMV